MGSFNPSKIQNKQKRSEIHVKNKKQKENAKRDERMRRRRHEDKNPHLREARRIRNVPKTIESKRTWDEANVDDETQGTLGLSFDVLNPKRRKVTEGEQQKPEEIDPEEHQQDGDDVEQVHAPDTDAEHDEADEIDSMLGSDSDGGEDENAELNGRKQDPSDRAPSEAPSAAPSAATAATDLNLTPDALIQRFPRLFNTAEHDPKVLITTSINSTLHWEAQLLTSLFPNSRYIKRTAHHHSYKYSIREIAKYAANRDFTHVAILQEELVHKKPRGLDIIHLPDGPMFHFTISNWVEGARIPGHGNPTNHYPELILNGFRTPLGLLTAHLFKSLFPPRPDIQGRQAVTLHNQRDYIFLRRHRYVFRDKRATEKSIQGADGKPVKGVEDIRAGLQELGPRFTLKLRRVDKGIQRMSGQEWEWKAHDEKVRTRFNL